MSSNSFSTFTWTMAGRIKTTQVISFTSTKVYTSTYARSRTCHTMLYEQKEQLIILVTHTCH